MLVDLAYNPQIHDWGWISFHLKEENAWDITFFDLRSFLSPRTSIGFDKKTKDNQVLVFKKDHF